MVPKGPHLKASLTRNYIWKSIHSVYDKNLEKVY